MPRSLRDLPKCELHIHLEGAMRTETLTELCTKHSIAVPEDTRGKTYTNFDAFATAYRAACECLREREDVFRIVRELLEDAVSAGCRWVEVAPSFLLWCNRFGGMEAAVLLLLEAAEAAETAVGGASACAYIFSAERHEPPANAEALATVVGSVVQSGRYLVHGRPGIVCLLLTTYYSPLTTYYLLQAPSAWPSGHCMLTTNYLLLTTYYSLLTAGT
jgi:adenosine deaminase